jgi:hypothetical protein
MAIRRGSRVSSGRSSEIHERLEREDSVHDSTHDLWRLPRAALPAGLPPLLILHGTSLTRALGAIALEFLVLALYLTAIPLLKEGAAYWVMNIRYGRKEARRRRRRM